MIKYLKLCMFLAAAAAFFSSGIMMSSAGECPIPKPPAEGEAPPEINQKTFMNAHGITQENYSVWMREHSVWRNENAEDLKAYSFIPQVNDPKARP